MNSSIENLKAAQQKAMSIRPKVGGFPVLAEVLRQAGVQQNIWHLPSCQSVYLTELGPVVQQGKPLVEGLFEIAPFNKEALVKALRKDQSGNSTFPEFLQSTWEAGVTGYKVDFAARTVVYYGCLGEEYLEEYPKAEVK